MERGQEHGLQLTANRAGDRPVCHSERSEESPGMAKEQTLHFVQSDLYKRRPVHIQAAQGDCQGIGSVVGFGKGFQVKDARYHGLNHDFVGPSVAGNVHFYLQGSWLDNGNVVFVTGVEQDAPGLCYVEGGFAIFFKEECFDADEVGAVMIK